MPTDNELNRGVAEVLGIALVEYNEDLPRKGEFWMYEQDDPERFWTLGDKFPRSPSTDLKLAMECFRKFTQPRMCFGLDIVPAGWVIIGQNSSLRNYETGPFADEAELAVGLCLAILAAHEATKEKTP